MADALDLGSDVITGATALGGLILVYVGGVTASFASYERTAQAKVKRRHRRKAWSGVAGVILSMASAACALIAKWASLDWQPRSRSSCSLSQSFSAALSAFS